MVSRALIFVADAILARWRYVCMIVGVMVGSVIAVFTPSAWRRVVRRQVIEQIAAVGVEGFVFLMLAASIAGLAIVVQAGSWLEKLGQSSMATPLLVVLLVREIAPLLTMVILVGRNGSAFAADLADMTIGSEIKVLRAEGIDPFLYLVYPRVWGMAIAGYCLTVFFIVAAFTGAYSFAALIGATKVDFFEAWRRLLASIGLAEAINVVIKTVVPGMLCGAVCCWEGLGVQSVSDASRAVRRAYERSLASVCVVAAITSVVTYVV